MMPELVSISHVFVYFFLQPNNPTQARAKCFNTLDAYCRLIALLVRHSGDASNNVTKINLLNRVRTDLHICTHFDQCVCVGK